MIGEIRKRFVGTAACIVVLALSDPVLIASGLDPPVVQYQTTDVDEEPTPSPRPNALQVFASDFKAIIRAPKHWQKDDWRTAGIMGGVTLGLFAIDEELQRAIQDGKEDRWDPGWKPGPRDSLPNKSPARGCGLSNL